MLPATQSTSLSRVASDVSAELQRRLKAAEDQIAKLQAENDDLRRNQRKVEGSPLSSKAVDGVPLASKTVEGVNLGATFTTQPAAFETSVPYLKHRLRMAEAEPAQQERRLAYYEMELRRMESLRKQGAVSQEEIAKSALMVQEAQGALQKSKIEIESLRTLLRELSEAKPASNAPFNKPTGVSR